MARQQIDVKDFGLFVEVVRSAARLVESAKVGIGPGGLEIYGAHSNIARCELTSNAVSSASPVEFSVESLQMLLRVATSAKEAHEGGDMSSLRFFVDGPFVRFESKKIKTKMATVGEAVISRWVSKKITTEMRPVFEFVSNSEMIKKVNSHSFMFSSPKDARVYVETVPDMENNAVFATLGNRETDLNNEVTLKFGLVTSGALGDGRGIILDLERLNLFNAVQSGEIRFQLMDLNCLVGRASLSGRDGAFFNMSVYSTLLKS